MVETYDLERFHEAQAGSYESALAELRRGRKTSHWMWFIFPQIAGLGHSPTAQFYAISSLAEARAYLEDPVLGPRLVTCTETVNSLEKVTAHQIFGSPDDLKFRSSMTLFNQAASKASVFGAALDKYFGGEADPLTLQILMRR